MMFEVDSLSQASPATVSRCGMVYLQQDQLSWKALTSSWLETLPESLTHHGPLFIALFDLILPELCNEVKAGALPTLVPVPLLAHVTSFLSLLDCLLAEAFPSEAESKPENSFGVSSGVTGHSATSDAATPSRGEKENGAAKTASSSKKLVRKFTARELNVTERKLESLFMFAVLWSFGAATGVAGRAVVERCVRGMVANGELIIRPTKGTAMAPPPMSPGMGKPASQAFRRSLKMALPSAELFNMRYDFASDTWKPWLADRGQFTIAEGAPYSTIIVPTVETVRNEAIIMVLAEHAKHPLLVGATGTGKSVVVNGTLVKALQQTGRFTTQLLQFSAQTRAAAVQDIITDKLFKRRQGVKGPPLGFRSVVFVDDLNMPEPETYGAQPPLELLRQWMDHHGWYDRLKGMTFTRIVDVQFMAAMAPPGGGRHAVAPRLLRHFNIVSFLPLDEDGMRAVFSTIMDHFFANVSLRVRSTLAAVVDVTVKLYGIVSQDLRPTPAKSHYTFSLRDLSKVFQGMTQVVAARFTNPIDLVRLWLHEAQRVFQDRLIDDTDRAWLLGVQRKLVTDELRVTWDEVVAGGVMDSDEEEAQTKAAGVAAAVGQPYVEPINIMFGDFADPELPADMRQYQQLTDQVAVRTAMEGALAEYNSTAGKERSAMPLVMFNMARQHCARITRCIRQPQGHALLVGVGGSGRRSLTRLSAYMCECTMFPLEVTKLYSVADWREDLKALLRVAGVDGKKVVFLLSDNEVVHEAFLEDINSLLNTGMVPNLHVADEKAAIIADLDHAARTKGLHSDSDVWDFFVSRCRQHLHIVLCMSPYV